MNGPDRARILVVDDNRAIHGDFRKILAHSQADSEFGDLESRLYGELGRPLRRDALDFRVDSAYQGQEAVQLAQRAAGEGEPYSVAFVDMRMPPGWDGLETIQHLWRVDSHTQIVICSAHSDYNWREIIERL